jgi:hypothetical protein
MDLLSTKQPQHQPSPKPRCIACKKTHNAVYMEGRWFKCLDRLACLKEIARLGIGLARSMEETVSPNQVVAIINIGHEKRIDSVGICESIFNCPPSRLSWSAAGVLIGYLKGIERQVA